MHEHRVLLYRVHVGADGRLHCVCHTMPCHAMLWLTTEPGFMIPRCSKRHDYILTYIVERIVYIIHTNFGLIPTVRQCETVPVPAVVVTSSMQSIPISTNSNCVRQQKNIIPRHISFVLHTGIDCSEHVSGWMYSIHLRSNVMGQTRTKNNIYIYIDLCSWFGMTNEM